MIELGTYDVIASGGRRDKSNRYRVIANEKKANEKVEYEIVSADVAGPAGMYTAPVPPINGERRVKKKIGFSARLWFR